MELWARKTLFSLVKHLWKWRGYALTSQKVFSKKSRTVPKNVVGVFHNCLGTSDHFNRTKKDNKGGPPWEWKFFWKVLWKWQSIPESAIQNIFVFKWVSKIYSTENKTDSLNRLKIYSTENETDSLNRLKGSIILIIMDSGVLICRRAPRCRVSVGSIRWCIATLSID